MRSLIPFIIAMSFFTLGEPCQKISEKPIHTIMGVIDITCEEVWEKILKCLKDKKISVETIYREQEYLQTGPFITDSFPGDSYLKIKEQYRIEIRCMKPLSARITCFPTLKGLTQGNRWVEIKQTENYEKRFLEGFQFNHWMSPISQ